MSDKIDKKEEEVKGFYSDNTTEIEVEGVIYEVSTQEAKFLKEKLEKIKSKK